MKNLVFALMLAGLGACNPGDGVDTSVGEGTLLAVDYKSSTSSLPHCGQLGAICCNEGSYGMPCHGQLVCDGHVCVESTVDGGTSD